jgi:hypothetical protein
VDIRAALAELGNAGAARNARRSLDEWARAQVEVADLVDRLERRLASRSEAAESSPVPMWARDTGAA